MQFGFNDMSEYIDNFNAFSNNIYWTEQLKYNGIKKNFLYQKISYKLDEKYLLLIYKEIVSFVMCFDELTKSNWNLK